MAAVWGGLGGRVVSCELSRYVRSELLVVEMNYCSLYTACLYTAFLFLGSR